ncbi:hypothetical protein LQZ18_11515 [Lachnospiraceae bacterium ZAX-1]
MSAVFSKKRHFGLFSTRTNDEVIDAAKKACVHDVIMGFPEAYQTTAGILLTVFRMLTHITDVGWKGLPVYWAVLIGFLILKFVCNIVYSKTLEVMIQKAVTNLAKNRTVLVIAHHLKTIRSADQIIIFDAGRIAEKGTHEELLQKNGVYHTL